MLECVTGVQQPLNNLSNKIKQYWVGLISVIEYVSGGEETNLHAEEFQIINIDTLPSERKSSWGTVAHACNPSYSGGGRLGGLQFKVDWGKKLARPHLKNSNNKIIGCDGVQLASQLCRKHKEED
jgi:hypothetical protein